MLTRRAASIAVASLGLAGRGARAQPAEYPNRPVRMIVPFVPGGASDVIARLIQQPLGALLGQPVVVENRGGASGNIGMEAAARSAPDGHVVLLGNIGALAINPGMFPDMPIDPLRDLAPVGLVAEVPGLLIANTGFPPNSVRELIDYVRARPGAVNFASPGNGSQNRLEMELFAGRHGLRMEHVPYRGGAGPAATDVMAGHVSLMFVTLTTALGHVQAGRLKALAVTTRQRIPMLPEVPTMVEQGFPENVSSGWQGLLVPAGTPEPVVARLHAATLRAVADPQIRQRLLDAGCLPVTSESPAEFRSYIAAETARWRRVIQETGARPE